MYYICKNINELHMQTKISGPFRGLGTLHGSIQNAYLHLPSSILAVISRIKLKIHDDILKDSSWNS